MFIIYIGSIIISYLITKQSFKKVSNKLSNLDLNIKDTTKDKDVLNVYLLILALIPIINIIIAVRTLFNDEILYNTFKKTQCENILKDNGELLNTYEKTCTLKNETKRRTFEKELNGAIKLINCGYDKDEVFSNLTLAK